MLIDSVWKISQALKYVISIFKNRIALRVIKRLFASQQASLRRIFGGRLEIELIKSFRLKKLFLILSVFHFLNENGTIPLSGILKRQEKEIRRKVSFL